MIFIDFEVFKYDWLLHWANPHTRERGTIINDKDALQEFHAKNKHEIHVGYNSRGYDQWIYKGILCGFDPYEISQFIIEKGHKGWQFSRELHKVYLINYDCMTDASKSLKQLEGFMGHDIKETTVDFTIKRKLTDSEIQEVITYCEHDVDETIAVFMENIKEFTAHMGLVEMFDLPIHYLGKTQAQMSAIILHATPQERDDEFDIVIPDNLILGRYEHIAEWYLDSKNHWYVEELPTPKGAKKKYKKNEFITTVAGVEHIYGWGGLHGARKNYRGDGIYILADITSMYPSLMIEYDLLSRNVRDKEDFRKMRDRRVELKAKKDPREEPLKRAINSIYGASKDKYNPLYDPRQANNVCIHGQLFITDLIDKIEDHVTIIQTNTDGVLFKLHRESDRERVIDICEKWCKRVRMSLGYDNYKRVVQKDVNNYLLVTEDDELERVGAYVKPLRPLDYDLPILNDALVNYFHKGIPVEQTIMSCTELKKFQRITKTSYKFETTEHNGKELTERVNRVFASRSIKDAQILKGRWEKDKDGNEVFKRYKFSNSPDRCFIINENINGMEIPYKLDRSWYINLAKERIKQYVGNMKGAQ